MGGTAPKMALFLAFFVLCGFGGRAQDLVQGAVDGLTDPVVAREASVMVQQQSGVLMARFDVRSRNMMLHVTPECVIDATALNTLLSPLGLQVRCFSRRDASEGPFRHVDAGHCGDPPLLQR